MGRLIATSEPNAMARTTIAMASPIISLPGSPSSFAKPSSPLYSTCMPASRRLWVAACAASYSGRSILSVSKATVTNAVRPSSLTVGPRGS